MKKTSFLTITLIMMLTSVSTAQIFKLDSVIYEQIRKDSMPEYLKTIENKSRLPILVTKDLITLFNLKDTNIYELQINYFTSRFEMAKKYSLKRNNKLFQCIFINLKEVSEEKIKLEMDYFYLDCSTKYLFKKGSIIIHNDAIFIIEYQNKNISKGSITIKEQRESY